MIKVIILTLWYSLLFADIDAEIEAIQNASVQERFKLMNTFKQKLIQMRQEERSNAIDKLKSMAKNPHINASIENSSSEEKILEENIHNAQEPEKSIDTEIEQTVQKDIQEEIEETEDHEEKEDDD